MCVAVENLDVMAALSQLLVARAAESSLGMEKQGLSVKVLSVLVQAAGTGTFASGHKL